MAVNKASITRIFTQDEFNQFAELTGDDNPIHTNPDFASKTRFGRTVAHGMFLYSSICMVLGNLLPGPWTQQIEQALVFRSPTFSGEKVRIEVKETGISKGDVITLKTNVIRPDGQPGAEGWTRVRNAEGGFLPPPASIPNEMPPSDTASFLGLETGQKASKTRIFTTHDLSTYAQLSGDNNPYFLENRFLPGGLLGGMISDLLGTRLPGRGTNWLKQHLRFPAPARLNEAVTAQVEITRLRPEKYLVNLKTTCTDSAGVLVMDGEALVLIKDLELET